jgi:RNA polymerase sigma-70 factor, ECF subfamily
MTGMQSGEATRIMPDWIEIHGLISAAGIGLDPAIGILDQLEAPDGDLAREWDREHDHYVFERLPAIVQPDFRPTTWEAFLRVALDGLPTEQMAADLGVSENAVLQAKSRILKRLRDEAAEFLK